MHGDPHKGGWDQAGMLSGSLHLTEEQQEKMKSIMEATKPKIEAILKEQREKMKGVMEDAMKELRPSLTPEQQAVFDDLVKLRADRAALDAAQDKSDAGSKEPEKKSEE